MPDRDEVNQHVCPKWQKASRFLHGFKEPAYSIRECVERIAELVREDDKLRNALVASVNIIKMPMSDAILEGDRISRLSDSAYIRRIVDRALNHQIGRRSTGERFQPQGEPNPADQALMAEFLCDIVSIETSPIRLQQAFRTLSARDRQEKLSTFDANLGAFRHSAELIEIVQSLLHDTDGSLKPLVQKRRPPKPSQEELVHAVLPM